MTKAQPGVDKNLLNVVDELEDIGLLAHTQQQINQKQNDRRNNAKLHSDSKAHEAHKPH